MQVKLLKDWQPDDRKEPYKSGTILDIDNHDELATILIDGTADKYVAPVEEEKDPNDWKKEVAGLVKDAVAEATQPKVEKRPSGEVNLV